MFSLAILPLFTFPGPQILIATSSPNFPFRPPKIVWFQAWQVVLMAAFLPAPEEEIMEVLYKYVFMQILVYIPVQYNGLWLKLKVLEAKRIY